MHPPRTLPGLLLFLAAAPLVRADSVVTFSELMYHPAAASAPAEEAAEWLELHNQMAVDVDLSRWSLSGGVDFLFPAGTVIPAGGYLLVAAVPGSLPGALGPWSGKLSNSGESITLRNNNDRVMDEMSYGTDGEWPCAPDGGGPSLAKRSRHLSTADPAAWRHSLKTGGTPGAENFPPFLPPVTTVLVDAIGTWKYRADGIDPGTEWENEGIDESAFTFASAPFRLGSDPLPPPLTATTSLPGGPVSYYFRRNFVFSRNLPFTTLRCRLLADDGAALYLNGTELLRNNLATGAGHDTPAVSPRRGAPVWREFDLPVTALRSGGNLLAAEVHQAAALPSYPSAVIASGPVGYWRLGETSTTPGGVSDLADVAAAPESGGQHGTMQGLMETNMGKPGPRPTDSIGGQPLLGFEATNGAPAYQGNNDGGNDVTVLPDPGALNFSGGRRFTIEAWVKGAAAQESGGAIIAKGTGGGGEQFAIDITGGTYRFFHWDTAGAAVVNSSVPPNNTWQHLVAVVDAGAGVMRIYVNGTQTGTGTPRATMLNNTHEISIGARKNAGSAAYDLNFNGSVDEVAVYDRALTPAEITAHYQAAFLAGTAGVDTADAVFAAELHAVETLPAGVPPSLVLNEVSATAVEVMNTGAAALDLTGCTLARVGPDGFAPSVPLPAQRLAAGAFLTVPVTAASGDRLILFAADGSTVLDSFDVKNTLRGRHPDGTGPWLRPSVPTPDAANQVTLSSAIVINEIMYDHPSAELLAPASPQPGQWIELHNKSAAAVDLSGWALREAVDYLFPPGSTLTAGEYLIVAENPAAAIAGHTLPPAKVFGPWSKNLSHSSDRIVLEDAAGNPADEVTFYSEGRWPAAANAGGSSLELRDPDADNNVAESWAASDESGRAEWQTFTWSGPCVASQAGEPTIWRELALLLIDGPGECLVDDVKVRDTVTGNDLIQNGSFTTGATKWRLLGNHRTSRVEAEPGNPGNQVLRVIASGPGEYQGNQIETTFTGNTALVANRVYEISLRAKWVQGAGRLNTRLYFNRLPKTNLLSVVPNGGTPAAPNSRREPNIGPSLTGLAHTPVIPAASQPVTVSVTAADPDGISGADVKYAVNGGAWQTVSMTSEDNRHYTAQIPGQPSGVIQFYVEARDTPGAVAMFPARGVDSRALIQVRDNQSAGALQEIRLVMKPADATYMHTAVNVESNEFQGATLVVKGTEVFYDIGVRLKGSFVGRNVTRVGFNLRFNSDQLYRGVHDKIAIDRSQHVAVAQGEIIAKHVASHAGGIPNMYDDLARFIHPQAAYSSACQVRMAGFDEVYLDSQWPDGNDGRMYEIEVIRWHTNTIDGNPESPKRVDVAANGYANLELRDWGNDREAYRWTALQTAKRDRDDFQPIMGLEKMFGLPPGANFNTEAQQRLDYDAWLRTLAYMSLMGPADAVYTGANLHNYRIYFRPHDGRALMMPWDWDSSYQRATNASLVGGSNVAKIVTATPDTLRRYNHHLYDIIRTTFNQAYMSRWTQHYGTVAGDNYADILNYINARATFVLGQLPSATAFNADATAVSTDGAATIRGTAGMAVALIEVNGLVYTPVWTNNLTWTITVPLAAGSNTLTIRGLNRDGEPVAGATAEVTVDNPNSPGWPTVRINEWMAANDGSVPDPAGGNGDDWFELYNPGAQPVDLSGWKLTDSPASPALFTIPQGWSIPAGGFLLVWADNEPAQNPSPPAAGQALHATFKLSDGGETILLSAPDGREIDRVDFGAQVPDRTEGRYADGGPVVAGLTVPSPGAANVLAVFTDFRLLAPLPEVSLSTTPGWTYQMETSDDGAAWLPFGPPYTATTDKAAFGLPPAASRRFLRIQVRP